MYNSNCFLGAAWPLSMTTYHIVDSRYKYKLTSKQVEERKQLVKHQSGSKARKKGNRSLPDAVLRQLQSLCHRVVVHSRVESRVSCLVRRASRTLPLRR